MFIPFPNRQLDHAIDVTHEAAIAHHADSSAWPSLQPELGHRVSLHSPPTSRKMIAAECIRRCLVSHVFQLLALACSSFRVQFFVLVLLRPLRFLPPEDPSGGGGVLF